MINMFLIICILSSGMLKLSAQDPETQLNLADSLMNAGNLFQAVTEYKRLLFFDINGKYAYTAYMNIGKCYKAGGYFANAKKYFLSSARSAKEPADAFRPSIEYARVLILEKNFLQAREKLSLLQKSFKGTAETEEINFWTGWTYFFERNTAKAAEHFELAGDRGKIINRYLAEFDKESLDENLAQVLSYVIPGAGQIYAGEYLSGLISLAWTAAGIYWSVTSFAEERVLDSFFNGYFVFLRFYAGNLQNSRKFAEDKNNLLLNSYLKEIENNYKGLLP